MSQDDLSSLWAEEEQAARAKLAAPGVARMADLAGLSAMQVFDAISEGRLPQPPMGETLDFIPIRIEPGKAVFQGRPNKRHYNPMGTVHGGWFAAMLDSALGCAVHSTLPAGKAYTTLELKVNLVRALTDAVPFVRAEGQLVHAGRQVATSEARIVGPDGKLYAHASTTCLIFDMPTSKS